MRKFVHILWVIVKWSTKWGYRVGLPLLVLLGLVYTASVEREVDQNYYSQQRYHSDMYKDVDRRTDKLDKALEGLRGEIVVIRTDVADLRDKGAAKALDEKSVRLQKRLTDAARVLGDERQVLAGQ
jgi:hypothetical protein